MSLIITINTKIMPYEDSDAVISSITNIFPDLKYDLVPNDESFPAKRKIINFTGISNNFGIFKEAVSRQQILDTAFDVMTKNLNVNITTFMISRQASIKGKISFILDGKPLGGLLNITLEKDNLEIWLEDQTWHHGREDIPRQMDDEFAMRGDGEPVEWFDKFGNPTIAKDSEEE